MILLAALSCLFTQTKPGPAEMFDAILSKFQIREGRFLAESIGGDSNPDQPMFNWGIGVTLSAENALTRLDPKRKPRLRTMLEMCEAYWNPAGPVAGFDVVPGPPFPTDRYYDDNAWMVMAYVESYEILGDRRWLLRAEETLRFVLSGEDDKLGGGIYWKEREKSSKNTCSNGPAAAACLAVYRHSKRPELLAKAKELYAWTKAKLQDPSDGLFWDNLTLDGRMDKTKWSYNTALMLRTAKELGRLRAGREFRLDAERMEKSAVARWVRPDGVIDDELQFAHLLFENLNPRKFDAAKSIQRLLGSAGKAGLFGKRWGQEPKAKTMMIIQASAIRAMAIHELRSR